MSDYEKAMKKNLCGWLGDYTRVNEMRIKEMLNDAFRRGWIEGAKHQSKIEKLKQVVANLEPVGGEDIYNGKPCLDCDNNHKTDCLLMGINSKSKKKTCLEYIRRK